MLKRQTYRELLEITAALNTHLLGARIQKIRDPDPQTLSLKQL